MGQITIKIEGSFVDSGQASESIFFAEEGGHAYALTRAVALLLLGMGRAIKLDHSLHDKGDHPPKSDFGFGIHEDGGEGT